MTTIDISYEVFLILKPYLPYGTQLTSTYRSPEQQLHEIVRLAQEYNRHVGDGRKLNITGITLNKPNTWVPVLKAGSAQEFDEVAEWPGLEHSALSRVFGVRHQPSADALRAKDAHPRVVEDPRTLGPHAQQAWPEIHNHLIP